MRWSPTSSRTSKAPITRYSREYAPAFRSAVEAVGELQAAFARDRRALPALPLVPLFAFTVERFALAAAAHSREREFAADAVAARVASGPALATALLKVDSAVPAWTLYLQRVTEQADGPPPASQAIAWLTSHMLMAPTPPQRLREHRVPHPIDSHPPLPLRLERLGTTVERAWLDAMVPGRPSVTLLPLSAALDETFTARLTQVAEPLHRQSNSSKRTAP